LTTDISFALYIAFSSVGVDKSAVVTIRGN
jgi:hypothetical protein